MEWKAEPPTEPGWYWIAGHYMHRHEPFAVVVLKDAESNWLPRVTIPYEEGMTAVTDSEFADVLWYGPVQPPSPPKVTG